MELFKGIRLSRGRSVLRKKLSRLNRKKFKGNISTAKNIGLIWDASRAADFQILSQFHQDMLERKIDLKILGYYPAKEIPDKLTAVRYLTCLKLQDINIAYRPVSQEAISFMNSGFDILIDTNSRDIFPLEYISTLSMAGLKVGIFRNEYEQPQFDLMIDIQKPGDLKLFLEQAAHYLEMINN